MHKILYSKKDQLTKEINELRNQLYELYLKDLTLTSPELVILSAKLDQKINEYQYLTKPRP